MNKILNKILLHGIILSVISVIITLLSLFVTNRGFYILSYDPLAVVLTFLLVLGITLFIYSFSNIIISVFITFNFFSLLTFTSLVKYELRSIPVIFNDLFLVDEVNHLNGYVSFSDHSIIISSIILIEVLMIGIYFILKRKFDLKATLSIRLIGFFISIIIIAGSYTTIEANLVPFEKSGPIYLFTSSIQSTSDYTLNDEEMLLLDKLLDEEESEGSLVEKESSQPNIIIIMNESFWDMDQLPNIKMQPNPYDYFETLKKESIHGRLEVPVFAGGTSNTEFEVLSSISTHMYEEGLMVYNNEIQGPVISLASILRLQGYHSVGLHPFWGWYYNRNLLYSYLGFNEFITDEYINDSTLKGYYISDDTSTNVVIEQIEKTEEPLFLFNVTMENHGPYDDGRYDNIPLDLVVTGKNLDEESQLLVDVYGQGIYDAVASLEKLINYLETSDEETVVLFFGDHLPLMGSDYKVYRDTGYLDENDDYVDKYVQMRTTPFILWSNMTKNEEDLGIIDASFIGPYLLDRYQLEMPNYYQHHLETLQTTPYINPVYLNHEGNNLFSESEIYQSISSPMVAIQKDILYGQQSYESKTWLIENNTSYNQTLRNIEITDVYEENGQLIIEGHQLYKKGTLTINKKIIPFEFLEDRLVVSIDDLPNDDLLKIKMSLIDTIEKSLARSNEYIFNR